MSLGKGEDMKVCNVRSFGLCRHERPALRPVQSHMAFDFPHAFPTRGVCCAKIARSIARASTWTESFFPAFSTGLAHAPSLHVRKVLWEPDVSSAEFKVKLRAQRKLRGVLGDTGSAVRSRRGGCSSLLCTFCTVLQDDNLVGLSRDVRGCRLSGYFFRGSH